MVKTVRRTVPVQHCNSDIDPVNGSVAAVHVPVPVGPPVEQTASLLHRLSQQALQGSCAVPIQGSFLDLVISHLDLQSLGRVASTCRWLYLAEWHWIDVRSRSRTPLKWEVYIRHLLHRQPRALWLPGNPDRHHSLPLPRLQVSRAGWACIDSLQHAHL